MTNKSRAFTLLELVLTLTILGILATALVPTTQRLVKRQKETELRYALIEVREAIDRFKKASDESLIQPRPIEQLGYPADFRELVNGVSLQRNSTQTMRFLRKIPVDPMTGEANWGMRSTQDEPDSSSWGGQNLFDIYSLSDATALDGSEYATW